MDSYAAAHRLKRLVSELYTQPFDAALKLETMERQKDLSTVKEAYVVLQQEIKRLKAELTTMANSV